MRRSPTGAQAMSDVRGIVDICGVSLARPAQPADHVRIARQCARYGLNVGDVNAVIQAAIGGQTVTQVLEGDRSFDLVVRWKQQYRTSLDAIRRSASPSRTAATFRSRRSPISALPKVRHSSIAKDLQRYVPLRFAVRGRDLQTRDQGRASTSLAKRQASRRRASGMGGRVQELRRRQIAASRSSCRSRCC